MSVISSTKANPALYFNENSLFDVLNTTSHDIDMNALYEMVTGAANIPCKTERRVSCLKIFMVLIPKVISFLGEKEKCADLLRLAIYVTAHVRDQDRNKCRETIQSTLNYILNKEICRYDNLIDLFSNYIDLFSIVYNTLLNEHEKEELLSTTCDLSDSPKIDYFLNFVSKIEAEEERDGLYVHIAQTLVQRFSSDLEMGDFIFDMMLIDKALIAAKAIADLSKKQSVIDSTVDALVQAYAFKQKIAPDTHSKSIDIMLIDRAVKEMKNGAIEKLIKIVKRIDGQPEIIKNTLSFFNILGYHSEYLLQEIAFV